MLFRKLSDKALSSIFNICADIIRQIEKWKQPSGTGKTASGPWEEVSADRAVTSRTSFLGRVFVPVNLVTAENLLDLVDHSGHLDALKKRVC